MDKRHFYIKESAFTLAEMMVILAVFSVIAAAILPVITAPQKFENFNSAVTGDYNGVDKWKFSQYGLSNINAGPYSTVAIGMQPTASSAPFGIKPRLMINKNGNVQDVSHITFLGTANSNVYYNGRLSMAGDNIAIGNDALWFGGSDRTKGSYLAVYSNNIAIGTKAMYRDDGSYDTCQEVDPDNMVLGSTILKYSIAIGNRAMADSGAAYSIAIGNSAFVGSGGAYGVAIGNYAATGVGCDADNDNVNYGFVSIGNYSSYNRGIRYGVAIGGYAGSYASSSANEAIPRGEAIGYYAGVTDDMSIGYAIGYYAGFMQQDSWGNFIGAYAGQHSNAKNSLSDDVFIGYNAGGASYGIVSNDGNISIGAYSGYAQEVFSPSDLSELNAINVGSYAGYRQYGVYYPINIGYATGMNQRISTSTGTSAINLGAKAGYGQTDFNFPINIGFMAGYNAKKADYTVCVGENACDSNNSGEYDIRIGKGVSISNRNLLSGLHYYMSNGTLPRIGFDSLEPRKSYLGYYNGDIIKTTLGINRPTGVSVCTYSNIPWSPTQIGYSKFTYTSTGTLSSVSTYTTGRAQLLITGGTTSWNFSLSSILLYSSNIYGPATTFTTYSDKRLKENIKLSGHSLNDLRKINIYEYNFKDDDKKSPRIGVIAQELQKIIPQAVTKTNGFLAIDATWINYTMINSIKELSNQLDIMQKEFAMYIKEFVILVSRVRTLEKEIKILEQENKILLTSVNKANKKAKLRE